MYKRRKGVVAVFGPYRDNPTLNQRLEFNGPWRI
jgi:hypothetical protein